MNNTQHANVEPTLLVIVGPSAVGKMSVGREIARLTGLRLFHNHLSIEAVLPVFDYGSPAGNRLVLQFRKTMFEEVAKSDLPGLIFTYVWAFEDPAEAKYLEDLAAPFRARGGRVLFVELEASLDERLQRNETPERLAAKPSKRNVERSKQALLTEDSRHQLNSHGQFAGRPDYLLINNTDLSPAAVAERVVDAFALQRLDRGIHR